MGSGCEPFCKHCKVTTIASVNHTFLYVSFNFVQSQCGCRMSMYRLGKKREIGFSYTRIYPKVLPDVYLYANPVIFVVR